MAGLGYRSGCVGTGTTGCYAAPATGRAQVLVTNLASPAP
jgi:hypothetical protein